MSKILSAYVSSTLCKSTWPGAVSTGAKNDDVKHLFKPVEREIEPSFPKKRKKKKKSLSSELAEDEGELSTPVEKLEILFNAVLDRTP